MKSHRLSAAIGLIGVLAGACTHQSAPPPELSGLWSRGPGACAAQMGIRFTRQAVVAQLHEHSEVLIAKPAYTVQRGEGRVRVAVRYPLPRPVGGARSRGVGVLVLERGADGWLRPINHRQEDARTGSARTPLEPDARFIAGFTVRRCDAPWIDGLRG